MSEYQSIKDVPVGTNILIGYSSERGEYQSLHPPPERTVEATILARHKPPYDNHTCVGFKDDSSGAKTSHNGHPGWLIEGRWMEIQDTNNYYSNYRNYKYGWWIFNRLIVEPITIDKILYPGQVCFACGLPAPHVHPNAGSQFVCKSCEVLLVL